MASEPIASLIAGLGSLTCEHKGPDAHTEVAKGRDEHGASRSARSAAYPPRMCALLARAILDACEMARSQRQRSTVNAQPSTAGDVCEGAALDGRILEAVTAAGSEPPPFCSTRWVEPAPRSDVAAEPFPTALRDPMHVRAPRPTRQRGRPLPPHDHAPPAAAARMAAAGVGSAEDDRDFGGSTTSSAAGQLLADAISPPELRGAVPIDRLFLPGIYARKVQPWLSLAAEAMRALREGRPAPRVPTVVVPQSEMAAWARGVKWDTRDPKHCVPMERSSRETVFPGHRQVSRSAVREVAAQLDWHDDDIVAQLGEGGVEARSECELTTVLSFHHRGLAAHVDDVESIVRKEVGEGWLQGPFLELPTVPARVLPRNVVHQPRSRVREDGSLECACPLSNAPPPRPTGSVVAPGRTSQGRRCL